MAKLIWFCRFFCGGKHAMCQINAPLGYIVFSWSWWTGTDLIKLLLVICKNFQHFSVVILKQYNCTFT